MIKLAPSILSADFGVLKEELGAVEKAGAQYLHLDVMDGHLVPNITIGPPVIESLRKVSSMVFDVHLMISQPGKYIDKFAAAGADIINFHVEAEGNPREMIKQIKAWGKQAAMTVNPPTDGEVVYPYLEELDMVLIMSVNPGFGGQALLPQCLRKAEKLRNYAVKHGLSIDIEMDGGIKLDNMREVINAGVDVVVVGSAIFSSGDPFSETRKFMDRLKEYQP